MNVEREDRLVIFANPWLDFTRDLTGAAIAAAAAVEGLRVVAICAVSQRPPRLVGRIRSRLVRRLRAGAGRSASPVAPSLAHWARRARVPLWEVRPGDLHTAEFIRHLRESVRPTLALSLGCLCRFESSLLACFEQAVNYHDAMLPAHRGLRATEWSLYAGDPETGFTFHHMTERWDEGPILLQAGVPAPADAAPAALARAKLRCACEALPAVLTQMRRRDPGRAQTGPASYHSRADFHRMRDVGDPSRWTWAELERRLRAFQRLYVTLDGARWPVTGLRRDARPGRWSFRTADGVAAQATGVSYVPPWLYRLARGLGARV